MGQAGQLGSLPHSLGDPRCSEAVPGSQSSGGTPGCSQAVPGSQSSQGTPGALRLCPAHSPHGDPLGAQRLCPAVGSASTGSPWGGVCGSEIRLTCMTSWCSPYPKGMSLRQGFVLMSSSQRCVVGPVCPDLQEKLPAPGSTHMQVWVRPECESLGKAYSGHC